MAVFSKTTFSGERVVLDHNSYEGCLFRDCKIVYGAKGRVKLDSCTFENCSYVFDGAAQDTLLFLTGLYQIDRRAIEATFENIRLGAQPISPC